MNGAMPWLADLHTPEEDRWFMRDVVLKHEVWVAEVDGRPVGFVALGSRAGAVYLQHIYVLPEYQRLGVGSDAAGSRKGAAAGRLSTLGVPAERRRPPVLRAARAARLVELTDGSGNEEKEPDALYEWAP